MSDQPPDDNARARAESLVTAASAIGSTPTEQGDRVSISARQTVVDALTRDLNAASEHAGTEEERLVKIETQTRVLAEAVIAITAAADGVGPAVQAVKDEM